MGLAKIIFLIAAPIGGMTVAAFSLKKQLPQACRWFGNYIGLSYVYFKSIIKIMKPQDHMTYDMINVARKASQQSQALRRQLNNTLTKVKEEIKQKKQHTFKQFEKQFGILKQQIEIESAGKVSEGIKSQQKSLMQSKTNCLIINMEKRKKQLLQKRKMKKQSRRFLQQI